MPKPILYYAAISPPVRAVLLTAKAIDLELELRPINFLKGEHLAEDFVKKNPQHTIPTLEDDGAIIWDSHAICTYLVEKYAKSDDLYPKDLITRAKVDQRLHFDSGVLFARLRFTFEPILFRDSPDFPEEKKNLIINGYDLLESFLKDDLYLVGNKLTVADFCCISSVSSICAAVPIEKEKYPNLTAWIERVAQLPYYNETNQKGADELIEFFKNKFEANKKAHGN